jgi:hypothetical protein
MATAPHDHTVEAVVNHVVSAVAFARAKNALTRSSRSCIMASPMTRMFTSAERLLQHPVLSSVGARACQPGTPLEIEQRAGRRDADSVGTPGSRW